MPLHLKVENINRTCVSQGGVLSTDFGSHPMPGLSPLSMQNRNDWRADQELPLLSGLCRSVSCRAFRQLTVDGPGERKESASVAGETLGKPNGKESQKRASRTLLKGANTFGISLFEEPKRRSNAWAGDKVMDRDAERVAGGNDAV